jgi:hypothetical protein
MVMHGELIGAALEGVGPFDRARTPQDLVHELIRCRNRLEQGGSTSGAAGGVPDAVADQLAYDVVLIRLARRRGIACDPLAFDQPQAGRARLERALVSGGLATDVLEGPGGLR